MRILTVVALFAIVSTALGCNILCYSCDFNYNYCYMCTDNAHLADSSSCDCDYGYYQFGSVCTPDSSGGGFAVWAIILIALGNFIILICIVACIVGCIRRRRERMYGAAYNRFGDPVAVVQPTMAPQNYGQPTFGNPTRPVNQPYNPTRPVNGGQVAPVGVPVNPYVPSNPYVPQAVCQICMQGNCDCQTSCGHPSHRVCLDRWTYPTCPTCGSTIPELRK